MRYKRRHSLSNEEQRKKNSYNNYLRSIRPAERPVMDLDGEVWRKVMGYDRYWVSNKGRVKSRWGSSSERLLKIKKIKPAMSSYSVVFTIGYVTSAHNIAKMVYENFVLRGSYDGYFTWNPKDGDFKNASLDNIQVGNIIKDSWHKIPEWKLKALMDCFYIQHNNDDRTLAKEFNIPYNVVRDYIVHRLDNHFNKIYNR